jgi:hypothetical protein
MKYTDKHGIAITAQGDRNGNVEEEFRIVDSIQEVNGSRQLAAKAGDSDFVGERVRLSGQAETLPGDIYDNLSTLETRWRPFVIDFTRTLAGREKVYQAIYETISSPDLDETMPIRDFTNNQSMAYCEWHDGEAVYTTNFKDEVMKDTVSLKFFAGAVQKTLRSKLFGKQYLQATEARAQSQGYIDTLNHLYMYPIIAASYTGKHVAVTMLKNRSTNTWWENNWQIMKLSKNMYFTAKDAYDQYLRLPILVMNKKTYMTSFQDTLDAINIADSKKYDSMRNWWGGIVIYDGATTYISGKKVTYAGPADNRVIMVSPKDGFKELVKQPLTMVTKPGTELELERDIWWACRGIICQPTEYCYDFNLVAVDDTTDGLKST